MVTNSHQSHKGSPNQWPPKKPPEILPLLEPLCNHKPKLPHKLQHQPLHKPQLKPQLQPKLQHKPEHQLWCKPLVLKTHQHKTKQQPQLQHRTKLQKFYATRTLPKSLIHARYNAMQLMCCCNWTKAKDSAHVSEDN